MDLISAILISSGAFSCFLGCSFVAYKMQATSAEIHPQNVYNNTPVAETVVIIDAYPVYDITDTPVISGTEIYAEAVYTTSVPMVVIP